MTGPLDGWLHRGQPRRPLELVQEPQASEDRRHQQTAEPPADSEQQQQELEQPPAAKNTLLAFLVKSEGRDGLDDASGIGLPVRKRRHIQRCTQNWQLTGQMGAAGAALLQHRHAAALRQLAFLQSHAWQRPVLGGAPLSPEEAGAIQCAQWDSQGELLVTGSEEGLLTVHATAQLRATCGGSGAAQPAVGTADPLLVLDTHLPKLQAVRWNPADENVVAAASSATRQLPLYDLQHTQGQPTQMLSIPQQSVLGGSTAVGLTDLAFFGGSSSSGGGGGGYLLLASGMGGQVFLWDARARAAPSATLATQAGTGAIYTVQLAPDQQVVAAGTQSGEVKLWDLRGGSGSTLRFGGTVHHHPLLAAFNLRHALTGVPGLTSQTAIPASAVHSMQLDPHDARRLAFHLGCGWSGVLDLCRGTITHLHAPAHAFTDEAAAAPQGDGGLGLAADSAATQMLLNLATAAPGLHRRACWAHDGRRFCVPSRRDNSLLLLDFAPSPAAGCYALREERDGGDAGGSAGAGGFTSGSSSSSWLGQGEAEPPVPPAVVVELSQAAICAAAHPTLDLLVAGTVSHCLAVAGLA